MFSNQFLRSMRLACSVMLLSTTMAVAMDSERVDNSSPQSKTKTKGQENFEEWCKKNNEENFQRDINYLKKIGYVMPDGMVNPAMVHNNNP